MEGFEYDSTLRLPEIVAGPGKVARAAATRRGFGRRAVIVVRQPGFTRSDDWARIAASLSAAGVEFEVEGVSGEPSPALVDGIVARVRGRGHSGGQVDVVVGIGGGSVLDSAKAVAGLLIPGNSVMDHLEGLGRGCRTTAPRSRSSPSRRCRHGQRGDQECGPERSGRGRLQALISRRGR